MGPSAIRWRCFRALARRDLGLCARRRLSRRHQVESSKSLASRVQDVAQGEVKVFVDTAPVMEKPLAARAGLGWQGKHTNLVSRDFGSWLFLGAIFTTAEIDPDVPEEDHCGACRRCLDVCPTMRSSRPTSSMRAPASPTSPSSTRDTSRRVSRSDGQPHLRLRRLSRRLSLEQIRAKRAREAKLSVRAESDNPAARRACSISTMPPFRARFRGTPIKRTGRDRFLRNVLIAAGNSGR